MDPFSLTDPSTLHTGITQGRGEVSNLCSHMNFLSINILVAPESNKVEVEMVDRDGRDRSSTGRLRDQEVPLDRT